jgi:hypothetical protein
MTKIAAALDPLQLLYYYDCAQLFRHVGEQAFGNIPTLALKHDVGLHTHLCSIQNTHMRRKKYAFVCRYRSIGRLAILAEI